MGSHCGGEVESLVPESEFDKGFTAQKDIPGSQDHSRCKVGRKWVPLAQRQSQAVCEKCVAKGH